MLVDEGLLVDAVLRDAQQVSSLRDLRHITHGIKRIGVHVLELIREHVTALGKLTDGGLVVIFRHDLPVPHLGCRAIRRGIEHSDTESHVFGGKRHHLTKLTASHDSNRRTRLQQLRFAHDASFMELDFVNHSSWIIHRLDRPAHRSKAYDQRPGRGRLHRGYILQLPVHDSARHTT